MQCSFRLKSDGYSGNKMKTINNFKNPYKKEPNLDNIVNQLAIRLKNIEDKEGPPTVGMPTCSVDQAEAVRRYYAAFPALKKGEESPLQYYLPPPAWCRKQVDADMQPDAEPQAVRDWSNRMRKERRNSYHGPRNRGKKRFAQAAYSRSFDGKETLPEWVTHEGVWDMEEQDPVREFIRAIALDEGYGTCENTVMEELRAPALALRRDHDPPPPVPDWDQVPALGADWLLAEALAPGAPPPDHEDELYAQFEAKFDRSLEALWDRERDQATPDDDYQDLPIDFTELLSSPSDRMFDSVGAPPALAPAAPPALDSLASLSSLASLPSLGSAVWSCSAAPARPSPPLHARLRPLRLASPPPPPIVPLPPPPPPELESFALLEGDELYDALSTVASTMRSFAAINHSRDTSGFYEVQPRRAGAAPPPPPPPRAVPSPPASEPKEDLLTSARTHFRPIKREGSVEAERTRYVDGDTFDIRGSLEPVSFRRSSSGGEYLATGGSGERYLEYRAGSRERGIDYGRLELTQAQSAALARTALPLRFPLRQHDVAVQTDPDEEPPPAARASHVVADEVTPPAEVIVPEGEGTAELEPRDWEELLADIRLAHAMYAAGGGGGGAGEGRKRRHSAALRCARHCPHPHARFLPCCAHLRPLTR